MLPLFFSPGVYQLAGRYFVAPRFRHFYDDPGALASRLIRVDLESGKERFLTSGDDRGTRATISRFFAKPNGSVAWMREAVGIDYVELLDRAGQRTVDSGPDSSITYASLELSADQMTVTWIRDGTLMSAPFN